MERKGTGERRRKINTSRGIEVKKREKEGKGKEKGRDVNAKDKNDKQIYMSEKRDDEIKVMKKTTESGSCAFRGQKPRPHAHGKGQALSAIRHAVRDQTGPAGVANSHL